MGFLAEFLQLTPTDDRGWTRGTTVVREDGVVGEQGDAYRQATVWRSVNVLAAAVATLPVGTFRRLERGKEPARDHWSDALVRLRPNAVQTSFRWRHHLMGHAVMGGNYYARKLYPQGDATRPAQLWPLDPTRTEIAEIAGDGQLIYRYRRKAGGEDIIPQREMFHVRGFSHDGLTGVSVFDLMRSTLSQASAAQTQRTAFLRNEMRPSVVIKHPGDLGPDAKTNLEGGFQKAFGVPSRAGRVLVLDEGMDITPFAVTSKDAQFIESEHFRVEEFLRYIGVPGVLCGYADKTATYASAEAFFQSFKDHNVFPWTRNLEQELAFALFDGSGSDDLVIEFNLDAMLRPDSTARANFYRALVELGILTRNEVRELENRNPLPGLDEPLTPMNMSKGAASDPAPRPRSEAPPEEDDEEDSARARLSGAQSRLVELATEAAAAVVRKEIRAFVGEPRQGRKGGAARYAADPDGWRRYVAAFYEEHAAIVESRLRVSSPAARRYCATQRDELLRDGLKACETWEARRVPELVALATGDEQAALGG